MVKQYIYGNKNHKFAETHKKLIKKYAKLTKNRLSRIANFSSV